MKQFACIAVLVGSSLARADVLFDNFAAGNGHLGNTGWSVAWGGPFGMHIEEAVSFTSPGTYWMFGAEIAIGHLYGPNRFYAFLHADDNNQPGPILDAAVIENQLLPFPNEPTINNPPIWITFNGNTLLAAGSKYWLRISSVSGEDAWLAWNYNTTGDTGQRAYRHDGGQWNVHSGFDPRGAFRIHAATSPACYANCDPNISPPILNVADFTCFLTRFAAGDPYANCDASTAPPHLNVADFACFLQKFAAGCP